MNAHERNIQLRHLCTARMKSPLGNRRTRISERYDARKAQPHDEGVRCAKKPASTYTYAHD